jgi:hypothetical protein
MMEAHIRHATLSVRHWQAFPKALPNIAIFMVSAFV